MNPQNNASYASKSDRGSEALATLRRVGALAIATLLPFGLNGQSKSASESLESFFKERVDFAMMLHPQYEYLESDLQGTDLDDPEASERDYFRRLFFGVKVEPIKGLRYTYLTDYSDRVINNQISRLEWTLNERSRFHLGYQKVPFGYEDVTPSSLVKPIERSVNTRFWNEVVGLGSYHSGLYYYHDFNHGISSAFGVTHNQKCESDWPDILDGDVSLYARISKREFAFASQPMEVGMDFGYQPYGDGRECVAVSLFSNFSLSDYRFSLEATGGDIDFGSSDSSQAFGWHAQVSKMLNKKLELVSRVSQIDTDGYAVSLSSEIRKAPFSGFRYNNVDSLYLGFNYLVKDNKSKLSLGYELGQGRNALSGPDDLETVKESVSGFRLRYQLVF